MLIEPQRKFVAFRPQCTASISLINFLEEIEDCSCEVCSKSSLEILDNSYSYYSYEHFSFRNVPFDFSDYYKFCIVRNQWDWVLSTWSHEIRDETSSLAEYFKDNLNFNDFVEDYFVNNEVSEPPYLDQGFFHWTGWKMNFIDDVALMNRKRIVGLENILEKIGLVHHLYDFPHSNKTNSLKREDVYTERSKSIVYDFYKEEIEFFGFEF